jgi:hypothetical protein
MRDEERFAAFRENKSQAGRFLLRQLCEGRPVSKRDEAQNDDGAC